MRYLLLALALIAVVVRAAVEADSDGVLILTDANFDEALAANEKILVEFYAPWCGHCKQLAPEYAKAAKQLAGDECKLAKVDATEQRDVAQKFGISGFPTLKFFNAGSPSDYNAGRKAEDIVSFMKKKSGPPAATISSVAELTEAAEANDAFVVGYFANVDSPAAKVFLSAASSDEDNVYVISSSAEIKSHLGVSGDTVVIKKSFDDLRNDLTVSDSTKREEIGVFVSKNIIPLINVYSREKAKKIFASPIKQHALFFTLEDSDHHEPTTETMRMVAQQKKGEVLFVNIPGSEKSILEYFSLSEDNLPTMILADMSSQGMKKYPFQGTLDVANVMNFLADFKNGKLKPVLKSEEPSPEDTAGSVTVLKGTSFKELVLDNDKDVLVEFYAPWCGHCKKLAPIYDQLGDKFASNDKVVIAKMDATANEIDVDGVNVSGFPTLLFFKGNDKSKPMPYKGDRDLESLEGFILKNSHNDVADEL
jgi:protein disulfide-isomerase A1